MSSTILVATAAFSTEIDGTPVSISRGETFHKDSPRYAKLPPEVREANFKPFTVDNDIEQATAAPGEKRSVSHPEPTTEAPKTKSKVSKTEKSE
jgi:hypothetical protein